MAAVGLFREEGHDEFEHGEFEQPIRYPDVHMQKAAGYVKQERELSQRDKNYVS